ncbi:MAG: hypothetical protein ABIB97_01670 [Patescibacteria group bacterium]
MLNELSTTKGVEGNPGDKDGYDISQTHPEGQPEEPEAAVATEEKLDRATMAKYRDTTSQSLIEERISKHPEWDAVRQKILEAAAKEMGRAMSDVRHIKLADLAGEMDQYSHTVDIHVSKAEKIVKAATAWLRTAETPEEVENMLGES